MDDWEKKTRPTGDPYLPGRSSQRSTKDCLVIIYTSEPTLLGKRIAIENSPTRVGRGSGSDIVLESDSVSRRHAHFEQRAGSWLVVDDGSTNGTLCNDEQISGEMVLKTGDRIKIGTTIFKFLSGADVEAQYHEEIYRMTIMDGLTEIYNNRYFHDALEREIIGSRHHERELAIVLFDIDHFKRINDAHGNLAGDYVLKELARIVGAGIQGRVQNAVFARCGGEAFAIILPETSLETAATLAEMLRQKASEHVFEFQGDTIRMTISLATAALCADDRTANELMNRADYWLYVAKRQGRDRVVVAAPASGDDLTRYEYRPVLDSYALLERALANDPMGPLVAFGIDQEAVIIERLGSKVYENWFRALLRCLEISLGKNDALATWQDRYVLAALRGGDANAPPRSSRGSRSSGPRRPCLASKPPCLTRFAPPYSLRPSSQSTVIAHSTPSPDGFSSAPARGRLLTTISPSRSLRSVLWSPRAGRRSAGSGR